MRAVMAAMLIVLLPMVPMGADGPATTQPKAPGDETRVLVLGKPGRERVLIGRVIEHDGYVIFQRRGARMRVPRAEVRGIYGSIEELYRRMRSEIDSRESGEHMRLARWCLTHNLIEQARAELREVLRLAPNNQTAQIMLRNLEPTAAGPAAPSRPAVASQPRAWSREKEFLWRRWMKAQSKRTLERFVQEVQPILLNTCGSGRCHGSASYAGDFRLSRWEAGRRVPPSKMIANLRATFSALDVQEPSRSPLLLKPLMSKVDPPTHKGGPVLTGPRKKRLWNALRAWVMSLRPPAARVPTPRSSTPSGEGEARDSRPDGGRSTSP